MVLIRPRESPIVEPVTVMGLELPLGPMTLNSTTAAEPSPFTPLAAVVPKWMTPGVSAL